MTAKHLKLTHRFGGNDAAVRYIKISHRRDALTYIMSALDHVHRSAAAEGPDDTLSVELNDTMSAWAKETLLQGSYIREYHLWEKDCTEYFVEQAARNAVPLSMKAKGSRPFPERVSHILGRFGVAMPLEPMAAIEAMRVQVNRMKHTAGFTLEDFVTAHAHDNAVAAIENFWNELSGLEAHEPALTSVSCLWP